MPSGGSTGRSWARPTDRDERTRPLRKIPIIIAVMTALIGPLLGTRPAAAQEADILYGKNIVVDGVNDFDDPETEDVDEFLAAIDDEPSIPDEELAPIWSVWNNGWGDAPIEDNWNHWIGPNDDYSANPMDMGKLYVTNDQLYLYIGVTHTDTDGKPQEGGFGYWQTQIGVILDIDRTPTGGNQSEASPSGYTDPWSNNVELVHKHRPDFIAWFDHSSNDFKLYRWDEDDEWWNEITQDSVDSYYPEFDPGFFTIFGDDGVPNRDQGPYSGPDKFVEFQIPLRSLGIEYQDVYGSEGHGDPPIVSVEALCTQPGRGAYDTVPSDTQIGRYPTMGDWSAGGDKTALSQYADYLLNESLDQVPPSILFEELPGSVILESSVKGLDRIAVVADISDQTGLGQVPTIGTLDSVAVFYTETAQWQDSIFVIPVEQVDQAVRVPMANISGTRLWLADIPDTVYFFIQADDGTYQTRAPFTPGGHGHGRDRLRPAVQRGGVMGQDHSPGGRYPERLRPGWDHPGGSSRRAGGRQRRGPVGAGCLHLPGASGRPCRSTLCHQWPSHPDRPLSPGLAAGQG